MSFSSFPPTLSCPLSPTVWAKHCIASLYGCGKLIWAAGLDKITQQGSSLGERAGSIGGGVIKGNQRHTSLLEQMLGQPLQAKINKQEYRLWMHTSRIHTTFMCIHPSTSNFYMYWMVAKTHSANSKQMWCFVNRVRVWKVVRVVEGKKNLWAALISWYGNNSQCWLMDC